MAKSYRIAGLTVAMDTFGRTEKQARAYLIDDVADHDFAIFPLTERAREKYPDFSENDCEYMNTALQFYRYLIEYQGILLHSSAVVKDGFAFLFSAASGTGKSTHTTLWREVYGYDKVLILNDDKPALRLENGRWYAYGTPWSGKSPLNLNMRVPLGGICLLERGEINEIQPYGGVKAVYDLLQQTVRPPVADGRAKVLDMLNDLMGKVPVWKLKCNMDPEAARVSHDAMYKAAKEKWSE